MSVIFRGEKFQVIEDTDGHRHVRTLDNEDVPGIQDFRLETHPKPPSALEIEYMNGHFDFDYEPK